MLIRFTTSTSMVAAAVAALFLAGCGGGSDNSGGAGTESGGLSTKTNGTGAASTNAANGAGSTETTRTAGVADANAANPAATPASSHGAITEAGISTELFEKILSTQTAYVRVGPHAYPISSNHAASQLVSPDDHLHEPLDRNKWMDTPDLPDMLSYQQPLDGQFTVHSWGADRSGQNADAKTISAVASFGYVFHKEADSPDKRLTLKTDAEIKNGYSRDPNTGAETYRETDTLKADVEKVIPRDGVVNFDESVQEWTHATGNALHGGKMTLFVQRGDSPDEVMFCLKMESRRKNLNAADPASPPQPKSDVQRTACSLWQVPANWTAKQSLNYNGIFVSENLNVEGNVNGGNVRYWKTKPASAATQGAAAAGQAGNGTAANTATDGVAAVNAGAAAATTGDATQNTAAQTANAAQADATSQAAAEAAAAADAAGNGAASVSTESGHAAAVAQQHGQAAGTATQPAAGDAAAAPADASQPTHQPTTDAAPATGATDAAAPAADAAAQPDAAKPADQGAAPTPVPATDAAAQPPAAPTAADAAPATDASKPDATPATGATDAATPATDAKPATGATDAAAPAADAAAAQPDIAKPADQDAAADSASTAGAAAQDAAAGNAEAGAAGTGTLKPTTLNSQ
ncbi:hypothetical protein [Lautropia mirabilis]|uniref:hypothetical protein n=1 Tax=Lautropia mirabilis TaxID=47671 RepID=UPI0028E62C42|nr:hypothetical protein [Lautropia mirabilis]